MAHTIKNKEKLISRIRRIRGQVESLERAVQEERDCYEVLQTLAACRGALNGLMGEILDGHIREHVIDPRKKDSPQAEAATQLIDLLKSFVK